MKIIFLVYMGGYVNAAAILRHCAAELLTFLKLRCETS